MISHVASIILDASVSVICWFWQMFPISLKSASGISSMLTVSVYTDSDKQAAGLTAINFISQQPTSSTSEAGISKSFPTTQELFNNVTGKKSEKLGFLTCQS